GAVAVELTVDRGRIVLLPPPLNPESDRALIAQTLHGCFERCGRLRVIAIEIWAGSCVRSSAATHADICDVIVRSLTLRPLPGPISSALLLPLTFQKLPQDVLTLTPTPLACFSQHIDHVRQSFQLARKLRVRLELLAQVCLTCNHVLEVRRPQPARVRGRFLVGLRLQGRGGIRRPERLYCQL